MVGLLRFLLFSLLLLMVNADAGMGGYNSHTIRAKNLDGKGRERQISDKGKILQVGLFPSITIGTEKSLFKCTELPNLGDYIDEHYLTKVSSLTMSNYFKADIKQEKLEDYFFVLKKELWSCDEIVSTEQSEDIPKLKSFYKVVNKLMGITEIGVIRHPKNVDVKTRYYLGENKKTAWVRETAYYTYKDEDKGKGKFYEPCNYEGRTMDEPRRPKMVNKLTSIGNDDDFHPYKSRIVHNSIHGEILELKYFTESRGPIQFADDAGITEMSLGSRLSELDLGERGGDFSSVAVCYEMQAVRPFPFSYRPVLKQHVKVMTDHESAEYQAFHVMEEFYYELLVPAKEEVWLCKIIKGRDSDKQFYRIFNEVVTREPVGKVYFYHTIVHVEDFELPENGKGFKSREIKYVERETGKTINYRGYLRFYKEKKLDMDKRDIKYNLIRAEPNSIFRTLVSPKGYDFRVGSRWDKIIGKDTSSVRCSLPSSDIGYNNAFRTQIRSIMRVNQRAFSTKMLFIDREPEFLTYKLMHHILQCSSTDGEGISFLRVKNVIDFDVDVHEIESYDGVEISFKHDFEERLKTPVRIIEVKYLDPEEFSVLKYEGQLEIPKDDSSYAETLKDFMYKIKKTRDDIVPVFGQHQEKYDNLRDLFYTDHVQWQVLLNSKGTHNLSLSSYPSEKLGSPSDVADCIKQYNSYYTTVVLHDDTGHHVLKDDPQKNSIQSQYIDARSQLLWECKFEKEDRTYAFRRMVNDGLILRKTPEPLKYLQYPDNVELSFVARTSSEYNMEFRNTFYTDITSNRDIMYLGQLVVKGKEKEIAHQRWKSGTMSVPREEPIPRKVSYESPRYILDKEYMYKTIINDKGLITLKLGSHWDITALDTENDAFECVKITHTLSEEFFNTFLKTKVKKVGSTTRRNDFDEYFEIRKKELWSCRNSRGTMWRVVNQFSIKHKNCEHIKELLHADGFTFLVGIYTYHEAGCMEVIEIKFMAPSSLRVFKFEGKVVLKSSDEKSIIEHKIQSESLKNIARKDQYRLFDAPEPSVFRKSISQDGYILEIKDEMHPELVLANRQSNFGCRKLTIGQQADLVKYFNLGNFLFVHELKDNKMKAIEDEMKLEDCLRSTTMVWKCEAEDEQTFYRVVNLAVTRERDVTENGQNVKKMCELARVYHSSAVEVNVIKSDDTSIPKVQIRQIRYFTAEPKQQVQFEGFVSDSDIDETKNVDESLKFVTKHVRYRPAMLHSNSPLTQENKGKAHKSVEIGSTWHGQIGKKGEVAWCTELDEPYNEMYGTSIFSSNREEGQHLTLSRLDEERSIATEDFKIVKQQIYLCVNLKGSPFFRVFNVIMDISKKFTTIYHHDGVTVDSQYMPDGSRLVKITEVKYLCHISKGSDTVPRVVRYDGKATIVSKNIKPEVRRWFQIPSDLEQDPSLMENEFAKGDASRYWPLDVLEVQAKRQEITPDDEHAQIYYSSIQVNRQIPHTKVIESGKNGRILVGSPWVRQFINQNDSPIKCLLDEWNPSNYLQFSTNVVLYINGLHYVLDEETIFDYFKLIKVDIWICTNDESGTLLRVVTEMQGLIPLQIVEYYDGVEVVPISLEGNPAVQTAKITEHKYVDPETLEVIQLREMVSLYKKKVENPSDNTPQVGRRIFKIPAWVNMNTLEAWWKELGNYVSQIEWKRSVPLQ